MPNIIYDGRLPFGIVLRISLSVMDKRKIEQNENQTIYN